MDPNLFSSVREKLRFLDLSDNQLEDVPTEALRDMVDLSDLNLSGNKLGKLVNGEFERLGKKLTTLSLSNCGLHTLGESAFEGLQTLRVLDLSNNELREVPNKAFKKLTSLETLYLGRNRISRITRRDFVSLTNLRRFQMLGCTSHTLLVEWGSFAENSNLAELNITLCHTTFDERFSLKELAVLRRVNFHGIGLTAVQEDLLDWVSIERADLSSNPFVCDCRISFLVEVLRQRPELSTPGGPRCKEPDGLADTRLADLRREDLECPTEKDVGLIVTLRNVL